MTSTPPMATSSSGMEMQFRYPHANMQWSTAPNSNETSPQNSTPPSPRNIRRHSYSSSVPSFQAALASEYQVPESSIPIQTTERELSTDYNELADKSTGEYNFYEKEYKTTPKKHDIQFEQVNSGMENLKVNEEKASDSEDQPVISSYRFRQPTLSKERAQEIERERIANEAAKRREASEEEKQLAEEHKLLHLLCQMYRCRECMPTFKDREEARLGIETNEYNSSKVGEHCCVGSALTNALPMHLPIDLLPITQGYCLFQPTRSFLTHPPPASAGVIQCYILKTSKSYELMMEVRDHNEWMSVRRRMKERSEKERQAAQNDLDTHGNYGHSINENEKSRARSALLEKMFRERSAFRAAMNGNSPSSTGSSSSSNVPSPLNTPKNKKTQSKGLSDGQRSLEDRMKENNLKSMLLAHAESVIMKGDDVYLMSAVRKRAWTGNQYIISMDREANTRCDGLNFLGKLKSNFGGTEFVMSDQGVRQSRKRTNGMGLGMSAPSSPTSVNANGSNTPNIVNSAPSSPANLGNVVYQRYLRECGTIMYDHFFEHTGSPIRIKIQLPNRSFYTMDSAQHGGSISKQWRMEQKSLSSEDSSERKDEQTVAPASPSNAPQNAAAINANAQNELNNFRHKKSAVAPLEDVDEYEYQTNGQHIESFENMRPVWHDVMNAYVLHFDNHRVREKSVKNFKLMRTNDPDRKTVLQFGRVMDRNIFVMDFSYPLSALQAFAICLSSIDPKLAV